MCDQKSGNISFLDGSEHISGRGTAAPSINDKKIFESSGGDSGFLSGPQNQYSSEEIIDRDLDDSIGTGNEESRDSGVIEADEEEDNTKDTKQSSMILDSGADVGLSEWFCGLNLKNSPEPINNLGTCRQTVTEPKYTKLSKLLKTQPLWEICYIQDADGDTQLHLAILGKYVQAVLKIIQLAPVPAFLDIVNDEAHAPLHLAVLTKQPEIVRSLLVAGAKATIRDSNGNTPLHLACMNSDKACVSALTRPITDEEVKRICNFTGRVPQKFYWPDLEQRNYDGQHCVHIAAERNDIETLRHLVYLGADINAREGKSGYTVLHFACETSNEQLAQFLINECTQLNVEVCTYGLLTAYQLAAEQKNKDLMCYLERFGAELLTPPQSDDEYIYSDSSCDEDF